MRDSSKAKVLLFDLELSPNIGYSWGGKWEVNVLEFVREWQIISVAWKWLGEKTTHCLCLYDFKDSNDKQLVARIHELFMEADVLVAHNGQSFDFKKANARFVYHKMKPMKQLPIIDTKLVARKHFSFNSNSLDDLGKHLGLGRKIKTEGFDLWLKCLANDPAAWKRMKAYNTQDVELLERVYQRLSPWIQNHPNIALMRERDGCPNCGHDKMRSEGIRCTQTRRYRRLQCQNCFSWHKGEIVK